MFPIMTGHRTQCGCLEIPDVTLRTFHISLIVTELALPDDVAEQ